jgi:uncharacterized protein (TIGR02246 family)
LQTPFRCVTVIRRGDDHASASSLHRGFAHSDASLRPGQAIDKLNTEFIAAFAKGDMAALGQMYTEDAYLLPPDSETVKGRAAIQRFWTSAAAAIGDLKLTTVDVKPLGSDAAREIGTFTLKTKGDKHYEIIPCTTRPVLL